MMKRAILTLTLALAALLGFTACSDNEPEVTIYCYKVYSADLSKPDMNIVRRAHERAFTDAKLSFRSGVFSAGTKLDDIIEACHQAEHGIQTAGITFEGYYVLTVYSDQTVHYRSTWGIKQ